MFVFTVKDMRVSSQATALLLAIKQVDEDATVLADVESHSVEVVPATAGATELSDAIIHAGFDPVLVVKSSDAVRLGQAPAKIPFEGFDHDFSSATSGDSGARGNAVEPDPVARIATSIAGVSKAINVLPAEALGPLAP